MPKISFGLEGIAKLLSNINHTKAAGPDKLPARLLKETAHQIAPMYTHLFSQSYQHGLLPDSWTRSSVCPIFKKGNRSLPENYRPISLTAIPCKLFEHIIVSKDSHLTYQIQHTLKWIPIQHRRTLYDLVTFYKISKEPTTSI